MVDTTSSPSDTQRLRLIQVPRDGGGEVTVWVGKKADDPKVVADAREAMLDDTEHEYRRLLYVAMTRAADRLIVAGIQPGNRNGLRDDCWYDLVGKGLVNSGLREETIEADGPIKRYTRPEDGTDLTSAAAATAGPSQQLPSWLRTPLPAEPLVGKLLRPSDPGDGDGRGFRSGESLATRALALQRGTLVHRLLQSLPDLAAERRRDAAQKYLARNTAGWSDGDGAQLADQVLALIADPRFAAVFAAASRAEVSIVGRLEQPGRPTALVSGQIDRLVVTPSEVLIVDFKTNHAPPAAVAEAPAAYVRQLALYRAVLKKLYPQLPVRSALLWTETPELMEISATALDQALLSGHGRDDQA